MFLKYLFFLVLITVISSKKLSDDNLGLLMRLVRSASKSTGGKTVVVMLNAEDAAASSNEGRSEENPGRTSSSEAYNLEKVPLGAFLMQKSVPKSRPLRSEVVSALKAHNMQEILVDSDTALLDALRARCNRLDSCVKKCPKKPKKKKPKMSCQATCKITYDEVDLCGESKEESEDECGGNSCGGGGGCGGKKCGKTMPPPWKNIYAK